MMEREWRTIIQNPNYEVSNYGEVRNKMTNYVLKPYIGKTGYPTVSIIVVDGVRKKTNVHRLVAEAFIPNPLGKPCVNHKDYNRANNYFENLEWVTHSENGLWSSEHMSKAHLGKKASAETRAKMRAAFLGKKRGKKFQKTMSVVRLKMFSYRPYPPYIYKTPEGYRFLINRTDVTARSKNFKTLDQALEFKAKWEAEHQDIINFTNE